MKKRYKTDHDILRDRILARVFPLKALTRLAPSPDEIRKRNWSEEFIDLCRDRMTTKKRNWVWQFIEYSKNRMVVGYLRYPGFIGYVGRKKYDCIGSIRKRLHEYEKDRNPEHLFDIQNLAMIEYVEGDHLDADFDSIDDGSHTEEL